jgi:hypothetical protein
VGSLHLFPLAAAPLVLRLVGPADRVRRGMREGPGEVEGRVGATQAQTPEQPICLHMLLSPYIQAR